MTILRQRDDARRVVLHLRSLIGGQSHHMEHLVQSLTKPDELASEIEATFDAEEEEDESSGSGKQHTLKKSRINNHSPNADADQLSKPSSRNSKRLSTASFFDVADRHLKDKTDAISHIIRNISEQCQAAVEGLQLAQDAEIGSLRSPRRQSSLSVANSDDGHSATTSEAGEDGHLRTGRASSIPPTPDLIPNRSSTSMSIASTVTTPERSSQQYNLHSVHHDIPTKIVEDDEDEYAERSETEAAASEPGLMGKHAESLMHRPAGARISALGGTR